MRTVFVNPRRRKKRKNGRKRKYKAYCKPVSNPRRRTRRRTRRRNAGITSFVGHQNPLILQNPPRIRRRRRNNPKLNLKSMVNSLMLHGGGSLVGTAANIFALRNIENTWIRNGVRVGISTFLPVFFKGEFGAATAGALLYPMWGDIALELGLVPGISPNEADLSELAADLESALDDVDYNDQYLYVP